MRSNGLTASTYTPVADLDPQLAEALLDDLKAQGVAAYTDPVTTSALAGPKDRLYVDSAAAAEVRELIGSRDPHLIEDNEDLAWARLVAGFDQPVDDAVARWPVLEDLKPGESRVYDERDDPPDVGDDGTPLLRWGTKTKPSEGSDDDDFLWSTSTTREPPRDADDDVEGFVPETPPPLPKLPPYKQFAWLGLIGGPLLLIITTFATMPEIPLVRGIAVAGFIGGFITLVATMGDHSDDDWDSHGGAVV